MSFNPTKLKQLPPKPALLPQRTQDLHQFEVICRVRPLQQSETISDITVNEQKSTITIISQLKNLTKQFQFNKIYNEQISQRQFSVQQSEQIFKYSRQTGKSSLIFSYGVTNSGKTYSILGTQENPGLLPYIIQKIETQFPEEQIKISAIQIYNDEFYSLKNKQKLFPRQRGAFYQFDEYQPQHITKQSTRQMMKQYIVNRYQTDTKSNKKSSRSHAIFKIETDQISIAIIDLAGSERINKAQTSIQESSSINLSLLTLGKCIHAIRDRISIPYRESKLTRAIVEYFTPQSKIYMIAHINRSGEMFHQNVNVLEYAAVSSQVKQLNPHLNYSIVKSAQKKIQKSKSKSCLKKKINSPPKSAKMLKEANSSELCQQIKQFDKRNQQNYNKSKKIIMENYINRLKVKQEEFDFYLDCQFQKQDQKDIQFIQEMKKARFASPQKEIQVAAQIIKAQSRIKLRKEILQQIQREKLNNTKDFSTQMGPSMRKCFEEQISRKRIQQTETEKYNLQQNDQENQRLSLKLYKTSKKPQQEQIIDSQTKPSYGQEKDGKQSYLDKLLKQSKQVIGNTFNSVAEYIRSHSRKKQNPDNAQKTKRLAIDRQFQFDSSKQSHYVKSEKPQQNVAKAQKVSRGIGSFSIIQVQNKRGSLNFSDLLKDIQTKSTVYQQDNSLLLSNISQIQDVNEHREAKIMRQIRQSQEFRHQNSPFFNNQANQPKDKQVEERVILQVKQQDNLCKDSKITKNTEKNTTDISDLNIFANRLQQTTQGSDWDNQTSKESNFSLKTKNNQKGKRSKKVEMKFYIQNATTISPLKTRNQKAKASQSRPK